MLVRCLLLYLRVVEEQDVYWLELPGIGVMFVE